MDGEDYNAIRERNIAERDAFFADFFKDFKEECQELAAVGPSPSKIQMESLKENIEPPERKQRSDVQSEMREMYVTRSSLKRSDECLKEEDDAEGDEDERVVRVTKSEYDPDSIPSPDLITLAQLLNVAERSTKKKYCKENGTSCHQCRQKTLDTKTVCRSGECVGVRGQFCGPCLRGRYGEDAIVALKDANWVCPPCRGLCNCSICRKRNGLRPTGILAPAVQGEGFSSVKEYLVTRKANKL